MIKIGLVGDVMLGRLVNSALKSCHPAYPWGNTLPIFKNTDLRICNLECVLSDVGSPWSASPKVFHFRSDEKNIETLKAANIDIASIANNHVLDYEYEALQHMLQVLDAHKILHAGAGNNIQEAMQPAICNVKNQKVALIAFTDNESGWEAQDNKPGIYYMPVRLKDKRAQTLLQNVREIKNRVDFLIVSAHWGPNWGYDPPPEQIPFAHALIDAGVDLIFGHSGHVFRGVEVYKNRPIIYCGGDFIDDYAVDEIERNDESFIFIVDVEANKKINVYMYPTIIDQFQASLAEHQRKELILSKMEALCENLGTAVKRHKDSLLLEID